MMTDEYIDVDAFVEELTRHEDNINALEDNRFGEIYLEDAE